MAIGKVIKVNVSNKNDPNYDGSYESSYAQYKYDHPMYDKPYEYYAESYEKYEQYKLDHPKYDKPYDEYAESYEKYDQYKYDHPGYDESYEYYVESYEKYEQYKYDHPDYDGSYEQYYAKSYKDGSDDQYYKHIDDLFDWGEATYKDIMPTHKDSYEVEGYYARIYDNGNAVGEKDGNIHYYDGEEISLVGTTDEVTDMMMAM